ncbi:MAG: DNA-binding MarR family transcriptional regulator [Halieaceae bacterium]|jgi:DNA-binding MarR family transcriptional regulator
MKLVLAVEGLHALFSKRVESSLSPHGISFTELLVMHQLNRTPLKTMRRIDLAASIGLTASGVTRLLKPMEKIGLVEKEMNARDARVSLVKLASGGQTIYDEAFASSEQCAKSLSESLSRTQLTELLGLIETLK